MRFLKLPENARFSNKQILLFLLPIFLEQLLIAFMSIADSMMIARSSAGEIAVAGVALVNRIDVLVKQVFVALAAGGSVIVSQYIGAGERKKANIALKSCFLALLTLTLVFSLLMLIFKRNILYGMYKTVDSAVMMQSLSYFSVTVFSYPLMTLYNTGSASYRAMGNSRVPLFASIAMMSINLLLKYIFIFKMNLGVYGAGLSTLIAYAVTGVTLLILLHDSHNKVFIEKIYVLRWDREMVSRIFKVGIPNGIENGLFQIGALILQSLVSTLGTASIAANALAYNITPLMYSLAAAFTLGILTFVGQCMGAGNPKEAEFYTRHIIKLEYICIIINFIIIMPFTRLIVEMFALSPEATEIGLKIVRTYFIGFIFIYPLSFALPNALRGAGDTKFTMCASITTMFAFRIGMAYLIVLKLGMGVIGIWYAMLLDWLVRSTIFILRFRSGKWKKIKVI